MTVHDTADAIADCVLSTFHQLPEKRKPRPRIDGSREWVPLAGIVLSKGMQSVQVHPEGTVAAYAHGSSEDGKHSCVSLG
jgi:hypothetical protein